MRAKLLKELRSCSLGLSAPNSFNQIEDNVKSRRALRREILTIVIPIILENLLQISAGIISTAMIGRLSADSISGQGSCLRLTDTLWCLYKGIGIGTTILVARSFGRSDHAASRSIIAQSLRASMLLPLFFGFLFYTAPYTVLGILTDDPAILSKGVQFMRIIVFGFPAVLCMQIVTAAFQGHGDTKTPMCIAALVNGVNIIFAYPLIFGAFTFQGLGIQGSAIALVISQTCGATAGLYLLYRKKGLLAAGKRRPGPFFVPGEIKSIYAVGLPASLESVFWQLSAIALSKIILSYGSDAFAAYQLGIQAETLTEMPAIGFGIAATTLTARALARGEQKLFSAYFSQIVFLATAISLCTSLLLILLPGFFMGLLTNKAQLIELGSLYIFIMGFIQIPQNLSRVFNGAIRAAGFSRIPMYIAGTGLWIFRIPLSFLAAYLMHLELYWIWIFIALDQSVRFVLSLIVFRKKAIGHRESHQHTFISQGEM